MQQWTDRYTCVTSEIDIDTFIPSSNQPKILMKKIHPNSECGEPLSSVYPHGRLCRLSKADETAHAGLPNFTGDTQLLSLITSAFSLN